MLHGATFAVAPLRPTLLGRLHAATRLAALILGLLTVMTTPPPGTVALACLVGLAVARTGLGPGRQLASLRPWLPVALLMLALHTVTTVSAAPLWHPSWAGVRGGLHALLRVATSVGLLGLYLRVASLDDLVAATAWWLAPLRRLGLPVEDLGLVLAVALGTAPAVLGEGRRIEMVVRLRRAGGAGTGTSRWRRWLTRLTDRARLVVPLLETLARRAEALSLSLRRRRPEAADPGPLPALEGAALVLWAAVLVWSPW